MAEGMPPPYTMLQALLLLLVLTNAAWRERVHRCDVLEFNQTDAGTKQAIVWEFRQGDEYPVDWITNPCGEWSGGVWFDANGAVVQPRELRITRTKNDPERAAYWRWLKKQPGERQGGIWRK
jgi:hypothetical protein